MKKKNEIQKLNAAYSHYKRWYKYALTQRAVMPRFCRWAIRDWFTPAEVRNVLERRIVRLKRACGELKETRK